MNWQSLTHGTNGLLLALDLTTVPMWAAMTRYRAPSSNWLLSPALALPLCLLALVAASIARALLAAIFHVSAGSTFNMVIGLIIIVGVGYFGGRLIARRPSGPDRHKRGTVIADSTVPPARRYALAPKTLTLAGLPVSLEDETKHFKLMGTTGTGKSTAIRELLARALERGDRAVIADPDAGYLARFHDPLRGDVILNPFDSRSPTWNPFAEIERPYDAEQLARALIAESDGASAREWRGYARTFLTAILRRLQETNAREVGRLWHHLAMASPEELATLIAGTPAQPFLSSENARMFGAIRAVAVSATAALEHIALQRTTPFAVRDWVRGGQGVLFLPYQAGQIAALRGVISAWTRLAIFETMSRPEGDARLWFIIDELDALGAIDGLKDALARLRKFGGRCVLGFQSIAQVSGTYGSSEAQTIVENCGNTLILRCSASEDGGTSRFASRVIGEREIVRLVASRQRQPGRWLAATGTNEQHVTEAAVMASEIEQLADLEGFLKFASGGEWRKVRIRRG
jgi:type IV secretory pathway TraG/TraD family ATPase VirD4